ncbi:hypothetical protein VaNZ11_008755 [Volvox africanus]|uniref:Uncharacterized protein n=1 Tax=Volvox africanus TaxID=51714 RepID=A0ABQ5S5T0_9CHLO|nr:hypothetical protein VaNZ11_008755 [Volvox africanus]
MHNTGSPTTASAAFSTSATQCLAEVAIPHTKCLGTQAQHLAYTVQALPGSLGGRNTEDSHLGISAQLLAFRSSGSFTPDLSWSSVAGNGPETNVDASISAGPVASSCDTGPSTSNHTVLNCSPRCPQRSSDPFLRRLWSRLRSSINGDVIMHEGRSSRHPPICQTPTPTPTQKQKQKTAHDQPRRLRLLPIGRPSQGEAFSDLHRSHTAPPAPAGRLREWSLSGRSRRSQDRMKARYTVSASKSHAPIDTAEMTTTRNASVGQLPHGVLSVERRDGLGRLSDCCVTTSSASGGSHVAQGLVGHDNAPSLGLGLMQRLLRVLNGNAWSKGQGQVRCDGGGGMRAGGLWKRTRNDAATAVPNSETWVVSCMAGHRKRGHCVSRRCTPLAAAAAAASEESSSDDADEALQLLRQQRRDSKVIHCARLHLGPRPQNLMSGDGDPGSGCALKFHLPGGAAEFAAFAATAGTPSDTAESLGGTVAGPLAPRASALLAAGVSISSPALLHSQLSLNAGLPASGSVSPPQSPAAGTPSAAFTSTATDSEAASPAAPGAAVFSHPGGALPAWSNGNPLTAFIPSTPLLPKLLPPIGSFHLEAWGVCPESLPFPATPQLSSPPPPQQQQQGGASAPVSSPPISRDRDVERDHGEPLAAPREAKEKGSKEKLQQLLPTSIVNLRFRLAPLRRSAGGAGDSVETPQRNPSVQVSPSGAGIVGVPSSSSSPMGLQCDDEQNSLSEPVAVLASTRSMRRLAICGYSGVE